MTRTATGQPSAGLGPQPHWRPGYHITGERNWINDPNGPVHWDGVYHLFFQANPEAPHWGPPRWGHVTSTDLAHWQRHPEALTPEKDGPDADGCWSGCLRDIDGQPAIYYTGVVGDDHDRVESVCRAWGNHDLTVWTKDTANPLIAHSPPERDSGYHRDPFIWQDDGRWHMLLGSGTAGSDPHGQVLRYESLDGTTWQYAGVFFEEPRWADGLDLGEHWECPQLVFDRGQVALILSSQTPQASRPLLHAVYFLGHIKDGAYHGKLQGRIDHGDCLYAPAVTVDATGRTLLWGWAQERVPPNLQRGMSHVGALSLPRVLTVADDRLRVDPAPEILALRQSRVDPNAPSDPGQPNQLHLEVDLMATGSAGQAEWSAGKDEDTLTLLIDMSNQHLTLTVTDQALGLRHFHVPTPPGEAEVRLFLDGSLVEVFVDGRSITTRFYPSESVLDNVGIATKGGASLRRLDAFRLVPDVINQ